MSTVTPKNQAKVIQTRMKELGYENFKLGQAQELLASLYGEQSWNVLSSKGISLQEALRVPNLFKDIVGEGTSQFEVKLKTEVEARCFLKVKADNAAEAYNKVEKYLESDLGQKTLDDLSSWEISYVDSFKSPKITEYFGESFHVYNEEGVTPEQFLEGILVGETIPAILKYVAERGEISFTELQKYLIEKYSFSEDEAGSLPFKMVHDLGLLKARDLPDGSDFIFKTGKMTSLERAALGSSTVL